MWARWRNPCFNFFGFNFFWLPCSIWLLQSMPGPPVGLGCRVALPAFLPPSPANVSVGLKQIFVQRSCVDASLPCLRACRSRVTALPRACQGRTGLAEIQGQRQYDMFGLFLSPLCWSNIPEGGAGPTRRSVPDGDRNSQGATRG